MRDIVEAFRLVAATPEGYEQWIDSKTAMEILGASEVEFDELLRSGLRCRSGCVDRYDAWNTGLKQGRLRSRGERQMVFFARMLRSNNSDWVSGQRYELLARAHCPAGDRCEEPEWPDAPEIRAVDWGTRSSRSGYAEWRGEVLLEGRRAAVQSDGIRDIWTQFLEAYGFQFASLDLAVADSFTRQRKVGDCTALSRILVELLQDHGYEAAARTGYIFGGLRTRRHTWVSVRDTDGAAKTLDPSMALLASIFFTPEYRSFCFGSFLNRIIELAEDEAMGVRHRCSRGLSSPRLEIMLRPK